MAPALVEPSTTPERTSVKFSDEHSPISVRDRSYSLPNKNRYNLKHSSGIIFSSKRDILSPVENTGGQFMNRPLFWSWPTEKSISSKMSLNNNISSDLPDENTLLRPFHYNVSSSADILPKTVNSTVTSSKGQVTSCVSSVISSRPCQPVAEPINNVSLSDYTTRRCKRVTGRLKNLGERLATVSSRLKNIQAKGYSSGIIPQINTCASEDVDSKSHKSSDCISNVKIFKTDPFRSQDFQNLPSSAHVKVGKLSYHADIMRIADSDTEDELDLESRVRIPLARSKKKTDKPVPPSSALFQWKQDRVVIGAKSTWLQLHISELDQKIASYGKLKEKVRSERKTLDLKDSYLESKPIPDLDVGLRTTETTDDLNKGCNLAERSSSPALVPCGAARVCPAKCLPTQTYVREQFVNPAEDIVRQNEKHGYRCSCMSSIMPCRLCYVSPKLSKGVSDILAAARLDHSYHASLSYPNDTLLSYHLEQTLRKERINTKVKITKSISKKRKKLKVDNASVSESSKPSSADTTPTTQRGKVPRSKSLKSKAESKAEETSRKRIHNSHVDSGTRHDSKIRKFSESTSETNSKPTTPLSGRSSPVVSHSLPLGQLQLLKKKKATSGNYDINNIVIPYSIAASTRVERIQYKEIPTPGWRNLNGPGGFGPNSEEDMELTDDECIAERHFKCELVERKRFTSFFQPVRRPRPPRTSECHTPDPHSPSLSVDDHFHTAASTPNDSPSVTPTASTRPVTRQSSINLVAMLDDERDISWTPRRFPLNETENRKLDNHTKTERRPRSIESPLATTPVNTSKLTVPISPVPTVTTPSPTVFKSPLLSPLQTPSPAQTPLSSPGSSVDCGDESWTVKLVNESPVHQNNPATTESKPRKGIVLKLAKK